MRYYRGLIFAFAGAVIGWYLHSYLSTPSGFVTPQNTLVMPEPVDLREYHTVISPPVSDTVKHDSAQLQIYLQSKRYSEAITLYNQSLASASEQKSNQMRLIILDYVQSLYRDELTNDALKLLNHYLEYSYKDVDAWRLKAYILARNKAYKHQIDALYQAKAYAHIERDIKEIDHAIRAAVDKYKQLLLNQNNRVELLNFYKELVYLEPNYSSYFLELAKAQLLNNLTSDARQSLELVVHDPKVGEQARMLLSEFDVIEDVEDKTTALLEGYRAIPLLRRGNHFVVEAMLNNHTRLNLIIDTGASLTIIKPERLRAAVDSNLNKYPEHLFNTANGVVKAPVLAVNSLAIGEYEVTDLHVGGLQLVNTSEVDGLLGMNFLKHFKFFIDQENNLLRLSLSQ